MARRRGKRGKGEGTIYQDKAGRWWAQLDVDAQGKRPKRRAESQADAIRLLGEMRRERERGVDLTEKNPTLAAFLELWLTDVIAITTRPPTQAKYREHVTNHIAPALGKTKIDKLTPQQCQRWVNDLGKTLAPGTVRTIHARLKTALNVAVEWYALPRNVAAKVRLPALPAPRAQALSVEDARRLLVFVKDLRLGGVVYAMILLGLRRGEALGLRWIDYNRKTQTIKLTQQVHMVGSKAVISSILKTDHAPRELPVPPFLAAIFDAQWARLQIERTVDGWKEHGLIFPAAAYNEQYRGGGPIIPTVLDRVFNRMCKDAGIPDVRVHDCRHTCASLLGASEVSEAVIGKILGHAPTTITGHYMRHITEATMRKAIEALERMLVQGATEGATRTENIG